MDVVEVNGLDVAYRRAGSGPPVFLLHGYVGDGPTTWQPQLDGLSDDFTVIAWDAPGAGGSSDPPEHIGMAGYADCLAAFISAIGFDRCHVVGLSFGGALAIEFAHRHPHIAMSLTLASAYAGWRGSLPPDVAQERLEQAFGLADLAPEEFVDALLPTMFSDGTPQQTIDAFAASMRAFHPVGFRAMARASAEDLRDALPGISAPTLLVYGDADVRAPMAVRERLHLAISGSELVVIPAAGHVCNIESPTMFNDVVRAFLASPPSQTGEGGSVHR